MKNAKSILLSVFIGILVLAFVTLLHFSNTLSWIENKTYDSRMKRTTELFHPSEEISVVIIDQDSLDWAKETLGWSWPWPRESYGKMLDFFNRANVKSVAFDMMYTEPSIYGDEDDEKFAEASRRFGRVVQTVFYPSNDSEDATLPIPSIKNSAAKIATVQSLLDSDGVARRARFHSSSKANQEPSLAVASLELGGAMPDVSEIPAAKSKRARESESGMYVRFMSGLDDYIPYSMKVILESEFAIEEAERRGMKYEAGEEQLSPSDFDGKYVFFGLFAPGLFDIISTPIDANYPGVGVHIAMMDTILNEEYLHDVSDVSAVLLILLAVALGIAIVSAFSQKSHSFGVKIVVFLLIEALYIALCYGFFVGGTILPVTAPALALVLSFAATTTKVYLTEGKQRRYLKSAFSQYLSPTVINNLIDNPKALKLGGEEREITAYFSDVQGFTSISENLSPSELTELLNKYLSAMTDIILSYGGTIDKYEGDAIIAFWNAPTLQPDHAKRAVEAAIACQKKLDEMQEELMLMAKSEKPLRHRIGLNTGRAVVGNMGSTQRFDYTMLGDTVNLASRLEGINKQFGTYTMCSKATMDGAIEHGCEMKFRKVSNIAVVGRKEGVLVFEPMEQAEFERRKDDFVNFEVGYNQFVAGDFEGAAETFRKTAEKDPAAAKYITKCQNLAKNPPEKWDGILRATEK